MNRYFLTTALIISVALVGCKSAKEAGEDAAKDKLDFAQGAADVLKNQGETLGKTVGEGATDLVKGVATGVKDSAHPPVEIRNTESLGALGITVNTANEAGDGLESRQIDTYLGFSKPFIGRLKIQVFDDKNVEIGSAISTFLDEPGSKSNHVVFNFESSTRLSKISWGQLSIVPPPQLTLSDELSKQGLQVGRIKETDAPFSVAPYLIFNKKFKGGLQLRAYDAAGLELERSTAPDKLNMSSDAAQAITFGFTGIQSLQAARYELHSVSK